MSFIDDLDAAAGKATCEILATGGESLIGYGAVSLVVAGTGFLPMTAGAIALLTKNLLCDPGWDPDTPQPSDVPSIDCSKASDGSPFSVYWITQIPFTRTLILQNVVEIVSITKTPGQPEGSTQHNVNALRADGSPDVGQFFADPGSELSTTIPPELCGGPPIGPEWEPPGPITYTNPETNCNYVVDFQAFGSLPDGSVQPIYKISPPAALRNSGGIIGGCNFSPIIYVGGPPGQPPYTGPWDPTWPDGPNPPGTTPPWLDLVNDIIGGVVGAVVANELAKIFATTYDAGTREIYAACNYKEDGTPETFSVTFPEENYQSRVLTSLDAIVDFQQQILLWRTPTCATSSPKVGDYRTISFISDEESPNGKSRLVKRFRYRSSSGVGLDGLVDHWKDFTWSAGPICVQHRDTQLGAPQVWAASIDEGKRVIRHAATEAGVDPDTTGRWEVSGSDNPRYGVPGTMRVNTAGGYYWITSRLGPDQRPPVALT